MFDRNIERDTFEVIKKCFQEDEYLIIGIEKCLSQGLDVNYQDPKTGKTFLMLAIENDLPTLFKIILAYHPLLEMKNEEGKTAAHLAACHPNLEYLDLLSKNGINLNALDLNGNPPINEAIRAGLIPNIQLLMDNEVILNYLNHIGLSMYDIAFMTKDLEVIEFVTHYEKKPKKKKKTGFIRKILLKK